MADTAALLAENGELRSSLESERKSLAELQKEWDEYKDASFKAVSALSKENERNRRRARTAVVVGVVLGVLAGVLAAR